LVTFDSKVVIFVWFIPDPDQWLEISYCGGLIINAGSLSRRLLSSLKESK
jgi:hypothetical protein